MTMRRVFDNDLIRDVTFAHRVRSVHADPAVAGASLLVCQCGHRLRSHAAPEDATRRLWKSHAMHVSAELMTIGNDQ